MRFNKNIIMSIWKRKYPIQHTVYKVTIAYTNILYHSCIFKAYPWKHFFDGINLGLIQR